MELSDFKACDGSRLFLSIPERLSFRSLKRKLENTEGMKVTGYVSDEITEVWIDFSFQGKKFAVNNQMGE